MKKIITLALLGATTSLMAMYAEHAYLYKDPRIMGMGGANIAVGGYSTSIFSNPAGLASINKEDGFVVDLLGVGASMSDISDFASDVDAATTDAEMIALLSKYSGKNFHMGIDNYTSITKNTDSLALSIGLLGAADINFMAHGNGSDNGGLLETSTRVYGGVVVGAAKPFKTDYGRLDVGLGLKFISQKSYEGALTITELLDDTVDMQTQFQDKYETSSTGVGLDVGATLHPFEGNFWNPAIGVSILNFGAMSMDDAYGAQPMTVNIGVSITPEIPYLEKLVLAVDYVDLLNANKLRMYDSSNTVSDVVYTDYDDTDIMKRLRIGLGLGLLNTTALSLTLNTGLYQGAMTAGVDLEFLLLKLNVATYEEQLGTGEADVSDRRYMVKLGIGW